MHIIKCYQNIINPNSLWYDNISTSNTEILLILRLSRSTFKMA